MTLPRRSLINPEPLDPTGPLTTVERHALTVDRLLPGANVERTGDVFQFSMDDKNGIVIFVTAEAAELRLPTVEWTCGSYGPVATSRLWKRVKWAALRDGQLAELLDAARRARQREFRPCKFCHNRFPPERRHGNVCHGCAERFQGIVH